MTVPALVLVLAKALTPATPPAALAGAATAPLVVDVSGITSPPRDARAAGVVDAGRKVFLTRCQNCHGPTGEGDGPMGRVLRPTPQRFTDALWQARVTDEELRQAIVLGGAAVKKAPSMPAHKDLPPASVDAVIAFVRSLRAPHGTASVTVMLPDGRDVVVSADADATGRARVSVPGVSGPVTVLGVVDATGAAACTLTVPEAAGAKVACAPAAAR